jgi:hypothetical protein
MSSRSALGSGMPAFAFSDIKIPLETVTTKEQDLEFYRKVEEVKKI